MSHPMEAEVADELTDGVSDAVRHLILVLADSKRLLGMRYAGWLLGAPELEAGIACASMAQDEWGHGRLLYSLLRDFGEDVDRTEHGRDPSEYANMQVLDRAPESWAELVALNTLVDCALTIQFEAFRESSYTPLRQRVDKLLDEERFHFAHGAAWLRRLAQGGDATRDSMKAAVEQVAPTVFQWFGPDSDAAGDLVRAGIADGAGSSLRERLAERLRPVLTELFGDVPEAWLAPVFGDFSEATRRTTGSQPDLATIEQVRGDKNRAFLMD